METRDRAVEVERGALTGLSQEELRVLEVLEKSGPQDAVSVSSSALVSISEALAALQDLRHRGLLESPDAEADPVHDQFAAEADPLHEQFALDRDRLAKALA